MRSAFCTSNHYSEIVRCSAVLASIMLKERLNLHGKVGCFLCVVGSTVLVIHAPPEENVNSMEELAAKLRDPRKSYLFIDLYLYEIGITFDTNIKQITI